MPSSIGPGELIVVLVIALIVLGPKRLPEVGGSVGKGMREFKDALGGMNPMDNDDDDDEVEDDRKPVASARYPRVVRISPALLEEIVAHARDEAPNECCGMIAAEDGRAVGGPPRPQRAASPLRYEMDGWSSTGSGRRSRRRLEIGAIYHSHTRSDPCPRRPTSTSPVSGPGCTVGDRRGRGRRA